MASYKTNKERLEKDAEIARLLQETGSFVPQPFSGPSAYDRMLGRSSQPSAPTERTPSSSWSNGNVKSEDTRPQAIKSEGNRSSQMQPGALSYRMPGSFFDDEDTKYSPSTPSRTPFQPPTNYPSYLSQHTTLPSRPSPSNMVYGVPANPVRRANDMGWLGQAGSGGFGAHSNGGSPFANLPLNPSLFTTANQFSSWPQPSSAGSFMSGGPYDMLGMRYPPTVPPLKGDSLSEVIRRTAAQDYSTPWQPWSAVDTDEEIKALITNIRPDEDIPMEQREGTPDALRYPLYPHQQLALEWMKKMEEGTNKGGSK